MSDSPLNLKVMSFNIRYGTANDGDHSWPFRRNAAITMLQEQNCSLVGLQEALKFQLDEISEALPHYRWIGVGREDGLSDGEYSAILYNSQRVNLLTWETFWFSDTPTVPGSSTWGNICTRACTHATFSVAGTPFDFYNLHIDHENAFSRIKSIELLNSRVRSRAEALPVIVTGDFNDHEQSDTIRAMASAGFLDTHRFIHPDGPEQTTFHGWTDLVEGDKIDYIFNRDGFTAIQSEIIRHNPKSQYVSDHYPLVAEIHSPL